ncbi:MAG: SAM-dependent methyltransferase [Bacilli bacterium]|nr:SAM-dependent methyltransferase [Bacilli bacterium]
MIRADMISTVGRPYLTSNVENDEFSYRKAFSSAGLVFNPITNAAGDRKFERLDIRFIKDGVSVLIETKTNINLDFQNNLDQLSAYVQYEKQLTGNKIIAILASTTNSDIKVWRGVVEDSDFMSGENVLKSMDDYVDLYTPNINDKEAVMQNTYKLNELLNKCGIDEELRSQFVGTCLLALKNGLDYKTPTLTASQIRAGIKSVLEGLLTSDIKKDYKIGLLDRNVLESQNVKSLKIQDLRNILHDIDTDILPFINDRSTAGQDLLNLFFVTFNKYARKKNKNQAFTPDHITDFMTKIAGVNKHSIILDPCCGSGSFLVRAMTQALDDCATKDEKDHIKREQIFGIEYDENIFGLATTNMLLHSDGNSNIYQGSCFDRKDVIKEAKPNVILMNPPYNANKNQVPESYSDIWDKNTKEDPTKGFYFVKYIADTINSTNTSATLAVLLPMACAIGGKSEEIKEIKKKILEENTLDAVFSLPNDVFYPGASASVCCMIFKLGKKHNDVSNPATFFGYCKDDGFKKKKNLGRVEQINPDSGLSRWNEIEEEWIKLYRERRACTGKSAVKKVDGNDEWLCEAYMETDYSLLKQKDFEKAVKNYVLIKTAQEEE